MTPTLQPGDALRRTIAIAAPIIVLAVLPEFSRAFTGDMKRATALAQRTMKFMLIVIFPLVLLLVAAAPGIIELLYGAGYDRSVRGAVVLLLNEQNLGVTIAAAAITYLGAVILFRAITPAEMAILSQLPASLLRKG